MSGSFTNAGPLRPTWSRTSGAGRGFQPPPAVPPQRSRSGSQGSLGSGGGGSQPPPSNKFAVLNDDDDDVIVNTASERSTSAFRPKGRSLADLAAIAPEGSTTAVLGGAVGKTFRTQRSDSFSADAKVTRYTREKLLALRPRPDTTASFPEALKHLEGNPILSEIPLDPVCWDPLDADEIWAQAARERSTRSASIGNKEIGGIIKVVSSGGLPEPTSRRASGGAPGLTKWQRGVALPPPEEGRRNSRSEGTAENPDDLWDDPMAATDAAADFSAFGSIPDDPKDDAQVQLPAADVFDFEKMTEASKQFDDELRGLSTGTLASDGEDDDKNGETLGHVVPVNPARPLATSGTTIRSGSGENVNVFEDFDDTLEPPSVKSADEDPSASSLLMKMIGVTREETPNTASISGEPAAPLNPWAAPEVSKPSDGSKAIEISSNPWGQSVVIGSSVTDGQIGVGSGTTTGFDLAARLEQERRQSLLEAESLRRRQEEEAAQRRSMEERARQQAIQQRQGHSQVELVLMERISVILENSWGRSDLVSILSTLHSEDSRVIPLLSNAEALRALIARHPTRVALRQDPAFGAEMAVLLQTNAQFQQRNQRQQQELQQQQAARAQQEEMQRREQQIRLQEQANQNGSRGGPPKMIPDAPWFYSDPQQNIQGPFRGEEMRQWLEAGYFKGDLPISQQPTGPFNPLSSLFPDLSVAFRGPSTEGDPAAAAREKAQREKEEEEHRAAEEQARAEAAAAAEEAAARQQRERERQEQAAADQKNSSAQLKMMLGLNTAQQETTSSDEPPPVEEPKPQSKNSQKQRNQSANSVSNAPAPSAVNPKPAWGSDASASGGSTKKSMSEIQREEARAAAVLAMERQAAGRSVSGGWANVAASRGGSTGWQGGAGGQIIKTSSIVAIMTGPNTATRVIQRGPKHIGNRKMSAPAAMQTQKRSSSSGQQNVAEDFGASMSPNLESWCKEQMTRLNGSDDLTLVSFCMTLNDQHEIRQYLTAYLGSTPQVNNFATEFINKRGLGNKTQQEEWQELSKPKKTKKKGGK